MKRHFSEWEKMFVNETSDKVLISKIYKQLIQLNIKTNNPLNQKMSRRPNYTFLKEDISITKRYMERCSTWPIVKERKSKLY